MSEHLAPTEDFYAEDPFGQGLDNRAVDLHQPASLDRRQSRNAPTPTAPTG